MRGGGGTRRKRNGYLCDMKKSTIWIIAGIMGVSLLTLLSLQFTYFEEVYKMRKEQFGEAVMRSLSQTAQNLELYETQTRLDKELVIRTEQERKRGIIPADSIRQAFQIELTRHMPQFADSAEGYGTGRVSDALRDTVEKYLKQKELIHEVLAILYKPSDKTLAKRLNFRVLDSNLKQELGKNGININYHFRVMTSDGQEVFRCQDYDPVSEDEAYRQEIFPNDSRAQMGIVYVHFPNMRNYIYSSVQFMIPAIIFTLIVLIVFCFTVYTIFRQKRLSEIKNDFINNMTHEFKTPISTISLAAQMLSDPAVGKSDAMFRHISRVINDETKRLRFQVEKVLQMSMFDRKAATFKPREVNVNTLVSDVVGTFRLKVESAGGSIRADLCAGDPVVFVDEMHFTNVIFNLMDNAVKYRKPDVRLQLEVATGSRDGKVTLSIADNGIGIRKEDLRKIFDRFYRVHTGNRHDVKGFGLGLAYVRSVIRNLDGTIHAESEYGKGTKFIITLPTIKN